MSEEHLKELKDVFEAMDEDGSGALSLDELREGLMKIGAHMSEEDVQRTFEFVSSSWLLAGHFLISLLEQAVPALDLPEHESVVVGLVELTAHPCTEEC